MRFRAHHRRVEDADHAHVLAGAEVVALVTVQGIERAVGDLGGDAVVEVRDLALTRHAVHRFEVVGVVDGQPSGRGLIDLNALRLLLLYSDCLVEFLKTGGRSPGVISV